MDSFTDKEISLIKKLSQALDEQPLPKQKKPRQKRQRTDEQIVADKERMKTIREKRKPKVQEEVKKEE